MYVGARDEYRTGVAQEMKTALSGVALRRPNGEKPPRFIYMHFKEQILPGKERRKVTC